MSKVRPALQGGCKDWIQNVRHPAQPWRPGAHRWHHLKGLQHFNYLKLSWLRSELQGVQETLDSQWEEAPCLSCRCFKRMRRRWQQRSRGDENEGMWPSLDLGATLTARFPFPAPLSFSRVQEEGFSGTAARSSIPTARRKSLALPACSLSSAVLKHDIYIQIFKKITLLFLFNFKGKSCSFWEIHANKRRKKSIQNSIAR